MKKIIQKIAYCTVAVSLFTACASDDGFSAEEASNYVKEAMQTTGDEKDEILIGGSAGNTLTSKGAVESTENELFATSGSQYFGIFMLAKNKIAPDNGGENYLNIDWSGNPVDVNGVSTPNTWSVYMDNVQTEAYYAYKDADGKVVPTGDVTQADRTRLYWYDTKERYYPIGNYHKYSFYGYYPYFQDMSTGTEKPTVTKEADYVYVDFDKLDGTQDVIWGSAEPVEGTNEPFNLAYSAKYFRHLQNRDEFDQPIPPVMKFKHKMMMLTFSITAGGTPINENIKDEERHYEKAYNTKVKEISITNAPSTVRLYVASKGTAHASGELIYSLGTRSANYKLKDKVNGVADQPWQGAFPQPKADGDPYKKFENQPDTISVGQGIILPALSTSDREKNPYALGLTLEYEGTSSKLLVPIRLDQIQNFDVPFQPGYKYNIILKIYAPEKIELEATCEPWKDGDNPFFVDQDGTIPIH